jgi:predicted nucleic acid-binding protein
VIYLLDVNALLAFGYRKHVHYSRVNNWLSWLQQEHGREDVMLATCAITELGFVRIAGGKSGLAESVSAARAGLQYVKARENFILLPDDHGADRLPEWVLTSAQTTDGHLLALARANRAHFATLDEHIPGAEPIPESPGSPWMVKEPAVRYGRVA